LDTISNVPIEDEVSSMEDIDFRIERLANGKVKDIEDY
jgi:hypothetical protein